MKNIKTKEYYAIFGSLHHTICMGKNCTCHRAVLDWIKQNFVGKEELTELIKKKGDKQFEILRSDEPEKEMMEALFGNSSELTVSIINLIRENEKKK